MYSWQSEESGAQSSGGPASAVLKDEGWNGLSTVTVSVVPEMAMMSVCGLLSARSTSTRAVRVVEDPLVRYRNTMEPPEERRA